MTKTLEEQEYTKELTSLIGMVVIKLGTETGEKLAKEIKQALLTAEKQGFNSGREYERAFIIGVLERFAEESENSSDEIFNMIAQVLKKDQITKDHEKNP